MFGWLSRVKTPRRIQNFIQNSGKDSAECGNKGLNLGSADDLSRNGSFSIEGKKRILVAITYSTCQDDQIRFFRQKLPIGNHLLLFGHPQSLQLIQNRQSTENVLLHEMVKCGDFGILITTLHTSCYLRGHSGVM